MLGPARLKWIERIALAATLLALVCAFGLELNRMQGTLPYPQHVDERPILESAARIIQSGDFNPGEYHYPSLPIYIATGALIAGLIEVNSHGPERVTTAQLGRMYGNYYEQPSVVAAARTAFCALGFLTLTAAALLAFRCSGAFGLLFAALLLLAATAIRGLASGYANVDTPLCAFMALCMWWLVAAEDSGRLRDEVVIPGVLCGAAIASKYTGVALLVPCLLSIALGRAPDRLLRALALLLVALVSFALFCPYFFLDLPHFLDGLTGEAFHYGVLGHRHHDVAPGLPQLQAYGRDVIDQYGLAVVLLALIGIGALARISWRRALVLVSLPVATLGLLCSYRVHFFRNSLPLQMITPVFAAAGGCLSFRTAWRWPVRALSGRTRWSAPLLWQLMAAGSLLLAIAPGLSLERAWASYRSDVDSRNRFALWAKQSLPREANVILSTSMPFAPRVLRPEQNPLVLDLRSGDETRRLAVPGNYMLLPHWNRKRGWAREQLARISGGLHALPRYQVIKRFDGAPVIPAKHERDTCVNPGFDLVRFY